MDDTRAQPGYQESSQTLPSGAGERRYLTYEELSALTGLSLSTLRRRVLDGTIPFFQPGGPRTRVVFPADVVDRLMEPAAPLPQPLPPKTQRRGPQPKWQRHSPQ